MKHAWQQNLNGLKSKASKKLLVSFFFCVNIRDLDEMFAKFYEKGSLNFTAASSLRNFLEDFKIKTYKFLISIDLLCV